ncbi:MAG TPA: peptidoglycan editing factor PgeF [Stellaceae bacterium]|nr:peptidoglycan editing factor PgeF [Stellaceae bacterium]
MMLQASALMLPGLRHGFFTREGGVSEGPFASLNCSVGSGDDRDRVAENRSRALAALGLDSDRLVTGYQVHGVEVARVDRPWRHENRPKVDALMTRVPGLALGILTADCAPVLFADPDVPIVAAAHAGWRGALGGVVEATLAAMEREGAKRARIVAAIGPCIGGRSYEVGAEFAASFIAENAGNDRFFLAAPRADHFLFDLGAYVADRLRRAGIAAISSAGADTCADSARFFSYRRTCLSGEKQFGHQLSAVALTA